MKKVSGKKERDAAAQDAERQVKKKQEDAKENGGESQDMLGDQGDEDVIF